MLLFQSRKLKKSHTMIILVHMSDSTVVGQTFARFRISKQGGLGPEGPAPDGEVEDHEVKRPLDFYRRKEKGYTNFQVDLGDIGFPQPDIAFLCADTP